MKEIKLHVNGIMCPNCVKKIVTKLSVQKGCGNVSVSDDYSAVYVKYNETQTNADIIKNTIESIKEKSFQVTEQEDMIS